MSQHAPIRPASPAHETEEMGGLDEHKDGNLEIEQQERLLPGDGEEAGAAKPYRRDAGRERHSLHLVGLLTFLGLVATVVFAFTVRTLVRGRLEIESTPDTTASDETTARDFRRPGSDYILDPGWDFNAPAQVREYHWIIEDIVANPDGVFRPMMVINSRFPGELIRCNEGDTIVVDVENRSVNATAIHWHGIFQNGTAWMDGVPGVTQCPIAPGSSFRYKFTVAGQAGTYFYHGHHGAQALDGLVGPLIIHSRDEWALSEIPYASDRIVLLQDWYYDTGSVGLMQKLSPGSESSPVPNGALINGANKVDCSQVHPSRRCDSSLASQAMFELEPNASHRLRILNAGAFAWFEVSVDSHLGLAVTEVDGTDVHPIAENSILAGPGQRYSIVLAANQTGTDAFWLRARMVKHCFAENVLPEQGSAEAKAVIRYRSAAVSIGANEQEVPLPATENDSGKFALECRDPTVGRYRPVPSRPAPEYAHHSWYLRVNLEIGDWRLERGYLNSSSFRPNLKSPSLHRVVSGLSSKNESFLVEGVNSKAFDSTHELVVSSKGVEVVDIVLQNFDEGNHPFHLHGHEFFVLASGHGYFPGYETLGLAPEGRGLLDKDNATILENPLRRDVATVEGFGWLLIRFIADHPGIFLFHCHMIWHAESGMAMQFLSRLDAVQQLSIPEANKRLCEASIEELEKGAVPKDTIFYGNV
ncbi:putative l-ascorbate oxidase [Diplogelasinospora grovesii]|uniref:L-ascorbate oxidase n=1 Tax=Diplogelasinospora grovesii TaxID=303347 RepID=A0AAN6NJP3_9PEZI|nr:putative l-ascorbate oxidase [Diplogelasinospora grovesii]